MFFPMFVNVENKEILVIGGGKIGARKAELLKEYGGNVTVYSEVVTEEALTKIEGIKIVNKNLQAVKFYY